MNERRKRITESGTNSFLRDLVRLRIRVDREPEDATSPELALREAMPLAALDAELASAAAAWGPESIGAPAGAGPPTASSC